MGSGTTLYDTIDTLELYGSCWTRVITRLSYSVNYLEKLVWIIYCFVVGLLLFDPLQLGGVHEYASFFISTPSGVFINKQVSVLDQSCVMSFHCNIAKLLYCSLIRQALVACLLLLNTPLSNYQGPVHLQ